MTFKEFIRVDKRKGAFGVVLAIIIFFFYFDTWVKIVYYLTSQRYVYVANIEEIKVGIGPIVAYNWGALALTILLGLIISVIVGYLISAILYSTILKEGWKKFFVFSKTKLFLTIGLLGFSFVLGWIAIEGHQFYLEPLANFFNPRWLDRTFLHFIFHPSSSNKVIYFFFNSFLSLLIWAVQMYVYSGIIVWIKDKIKARK